MLTETPLLCGCRWAMPLLLVALTLGPAGGQTPTPDCDFNDDGVVDAADLLLFHRSWHASAGAAPTPTETPAGSPDRLTIALPGEATMEFVLCPAGTFEMGSIDPDWSGSSERPPHSVTLAEPLYVQTTEVTQRQWRAVMGSNPSFYSSCGDDCPVESVSWNDCQTFIAALNAHAAGTGQATATFRLPSEAEWEYAARAGTTTRFHFGDSTCDRSSCGFCDLSDYAWWCGNNDPSGTKPVARKLPNAWGLYDVHGNVWEWCVDTWHANYDGAPADGSAWIDGASTYRLVRGGGWINIPRHCRSAYRLQQAPDDRLEVIGLRLAGDRG